MILSRFKHNLLLLSSCRVGIPGQGTVTACAYRHKTIVSIRLSKAESTMHFLAICKIHVLLRSRADASVVMVKLPIL